jgi:hypothetical protein
VPEQPRESPTIEKVKILPSLESTPAIIEWVPMRPSTSSYKPQS